MTALEALQHFSEENQAKLIAEIAKQQNAPHVILFESGPRDFLSADAFYNSPRTFLSNVIVWKQTEDGHDYWEAVFNSLPK